MIQVLGYFNLTLLLCLFCPFLFRRINKSFFMNKNLLFRKVAVNFAKVHPYLGMILLLSAAFHGYLALGVIRMHTGTVLWTGILIQVMLGLSVKNIKKPILLKIHRPFGLVPIILVLAHLTF